MAKIVEFMANNQAVLQETNGTMFFQSYDSIIAKCNPCGKNIVVDNDESGDKTPKGTVFSKTTSKYLTMFLEKYGWITPRKKGTVAQWLKMLEDNEIISRANLNA